MGVSLWSASAGRGHPVCWLIQTTGHVGPNCDWLIISILLDRPTRCCAHSTPAFCLSALALRSACTPCFFVMTKSSPLMREAALLAQNEPV